MDIINKTSENIIAATFPKEATPPRRERLQNFYNSCWQLSRLIDFSAAEDDLVRYSAVPALGIYATRAALFEVIRDEMVSMSTARVVADEVGFVCQNLQTRCPVDRGVFSGKKLGFYAEIGMLNMVWHGIAEGQLALDYAFLLGQHGIEASRQGLKGDVDMLVRRPATQHKKASRKKIQIKAANKRVNYIYENDITVIAAQGLLPEGEDTPAAVAKLMIWDNENQETRRHTYAKFLAKLSN